MIIFATKTPSRQVFFTNASFFSSSLPRFFASIFSPLCLRALVAIFNVGCGDGAAISRQFQVNFNFFNF
jgi:hypothetical protein